MLPSMVPWGPGGGFAAETSDGPASGRETPSKTGEIGVGGFDDYPYDTYGGSGDIPFYQVQEMTSSTAAVQAAVNSLVAAGGADGPESHVPALHAVATGCGDGGGAYGVPNDPDGACTDAALCAPSTSTWGSSRMISIRAGRYTPISPSMARWSSIRIPQTFN